MIGTNNVGICDKQPQLITNHLHGNYFSALNPKKCIFFIWEFGYFNDFIFGFNMED